jgi:hypothetical protein
MIRTFYPWNAMNGAGHVFSFIYQFYYLFFSMAISNSLDVLFCSWLLFACEQLQHLKAIMKPLMELSATLDTVVPNSGELFKVCALILQMKNMFTLTVAYALIAYSISIIWNEYYLDFFHPFVLSSIMSTNEIYKFIYLAKKKKKNNETSTYFSTHFSTYFLFIDLETARHSIYYTI